MSDMDSWVVVKFGGTSVASVGGWENIESIILRHFQRNKRVLLVCSAPASVSDRLTQLYDLAMKRQDVDVILSEIHGIYTSLSVDLGLAKHAAWEAQWDHLIHCTQEIIALGKYSAQHKARLLSFGEILLTQVASAFLEKQSLFNFWFFAGDFLKSCSNESSKSIASYLNTHCFYDEDVTMLSTLNEREERLAITQGFIASNSHDETVLLGRGGGSDVSASYFSAKLNACACEIWTDVPGIYSANPHVIPQARHLLQLTYEEAQEIALMGAKVLHPRAVVPLVKQSIPMSIKQTMQPDREGTAITVLSEGSPAIKAVSMRSDVVVLSIEALTMWQQSGFLSEIFACFKQHQPLILNKKSGKMASI